MNKIIICLTLCFALSGVAQPPTSSIANILPTAKKALVHVGFSLMLCFNIISCDNPYKAPEDLKRMVSKIEQQVIGVTSQQVGTIVKQDGFWYRESEDVSVSANGTLSPHYTRLFSDSRPGVFSHKQSGHFNYYPIKLYDEMGEFLPDALQVGWNVLYVKGNKYLTAYIGSKSGPSLNLLHLNETIDSSQVLAVVVLGANSYYNKKVMFASTHIMPHGNIDTYIADNIDQLVEIDAPHFYGRVLLPYTNDTFAVTIDGYGTLLSPSQLFVVKETRGLYEHYDLILYIKGEDLTLMEE